MRTRPASITALALSASLTAIAAPASAQEGGDECETPLARRPIEITPARGAQQVTIDAPIAVRYSAGYFGAEGPGDPPETLIEVVRCPGVGAGPCGLGCDLRDGAPLDGTVQVIGDQLFFLPDGGLEDGAVYAGRAEGIDGVLEFSFCSGTAPDLSAPRLGRFLGAVPAPAGASCALPEGGRRVGLRWEPAVDDGPAGSIEYFLYLTRARGIDRPVLRDRLRNFASDFVTMTLLLDRDESAEPVCVRMFAADGVGTLSEASDEVCVDPLTSAAFQPLCTVSHRRVGGWPVLALSLLGLLAGLAAVARSKRRTARARCCR